VPHPKHDQVRQRFDGRCGYCGVSEIDAGGELTVDHYQPLAAGGDESLDNLVYACIRCNQYKGDFWPTEADLAGGLRALHPCRDHVQEHIEEDACSGSLRARTRTGQFHLDLLQLNRPALIQHRLRRRLVRLLEERQAVLAAEVEFLRANIAAQEVYIAHLRKALGLPPLAGR